jgi:predicted transport protein
MADDSWTLDDLFKDRPDNRKLYDVIERYIKSLGGVNVEVMKTQISFGAKTKFAWVWLPQMWTKKRPEKSVVLTFDVDHRVSDPRIVESVEPRPGRWTHHVVIEKEDDLDDVVKGWLREAHGLGQTDRRKRKSSG